MPGFVYQQRPWNEVWLSNVPRKTAVKDYPGRRWIDEAFNPRYEASTAPAPVGTARKDVQIIALLVTEEESNRLGADTWIEVKSSVQWPKKPYLAGYAEASAQPTGTCYEGRMVIGENVTENYCVYTLGGDRWVAGGPS